MKSTVKVSISGIAFNIEHDAYHLLKGYLDKLSSHFSENESGQEVMDDIEARLAELLLSKISEPEQSITQKEVNDVIVILGKPEDLKDDSTGTGSNASSTRSSFISTKKRLYRNPNNQVLSGVCGGLGVYFNIDPVFFRILFIVLTLSAPFLWFMNLSVIVVVTYVVLWISLPQALTMAQKLEMQGESPSVANMERKMREEVAFSKPQRGTIAKLVRASFYTLASIVALPAIAVCLALTIAFVAVSFAGGWVLYDTIFPIMNFLSISENHLYIIKLFSIITILVPFILLVYIGIRLLFRLRTKGKSIIALLGVTWIVSVIILAGASLVALRDYRSGAKVVTKEDFSTSSDTLYVSIPQHFDSYNTRFYIGWSSNDRHPHIPYLWTSEQEDTMYLFPKVNIQYVDDSTFYINCNRYARAKSKRLAQEKAAKLPTQYYVADSLVTITPQQFTKEHKWSGELGKLTIYVPRDKKVVLDERLDYSSKYNNYWDNDDFDL